MPAHNGPAGLCGTIEYFLDTMFNYPTFAEAYKVAALSGLNKIHAQEPSASSGFPRAAAS
jgi:hypothetical protein